MAVVFDRLRNERGEVALNMGVILLVSVLIFGIVFNIRHAYQVVDLVKDRTNEAVLAVAAANGPAAFQGVREAEAVVRNYGDDFWRRAVSTSEVRQALRESLGASYDGSSLVRAGSYRIENLVTSYVNSDGDTLSFLTTMDLTISLMGGGGLEVERHLEVRSTYEAKF